MDDEVHRMPTSLDPSLEGADEVKLAERLRYLARQKSEASKMLAEAKSLRQTDHEGPPRADLYSFVAPEQTDEWQAADLIETLLSTEEARGALVSLAISAKRIADALELQGRLVEALARGLYNVEIEQ